LADYDELQIACYFKTEDIGKSIIMRYTFAGASNDATSTASIVETEITIESENQMITIDLANEATDIDHLHRLCAIKFKNSSSGEIKFNVDYVAIKPSPITSILYVPICNASNAIVNVYNITGTLLRKAVKDSEATIGLTKGFYIVGSKKIFVTD
jgi:hypothetical protein